MVPPTLLIKLWLENHIFIFSISSLKQPAGGASYYARRLSKSRPSYFVKIIVKLHFGRTLKIVKLKNWVSVYKTFKKLFQNYSTEFLDIGHK